MATRVCSRRWWFYIYVEMAWLRQVVCCPASKEEMTTCIVFGNASLGADWFAVSTLVGLGTTTSSSAR